MGTTPWVVPREKKWGSHWFMGYVMSNNEDSLRVTRVLNGSTGESSREAGQGTRWGL